MPLLYGEGSRAFMRLQEEIIKISSDQSIFAWTNPPIGNFLATADRPMTPIEITDYDGMLSTSPALFQSSGNVERLHSDIPGQKAAISTNRGIQLSLLMCPDPTDTTGLTHVAVLACQIGQVSGTRPGIFLRRLSPHSVQYGRLRSYLLHLGSFHRQGSFRFQGFNPSLPQEQLTEVYSGESIHLVYPAVCGTPRLKEKNLERVFQDWTVKSIFVKHEILVPIRPAFRLVQPKLFCNNEIRVMQAYPPHLWDANTHVMQQQEHVAGKDNHTTVVGTLYVDWMGQEFILVFGTAATAWSQPKLPWCEIIPGGEVDPPRWSDLKDVYQNFDVDGVRITDDARNEGHKFTLESRYVTTVAELKLDVFQKEMYLLHLS
ncbi:hypothetical protein IFR05_002371 [Cadophora sp. M221]|nr:hypothetical protein IFR05_002371 [Cadophora sp. M221]